MRYYGMKDMVRADCRDCMGCSSCCEGMGDSILLDPLDIYRLTHGLDRSFSDLLSEGVGLHVEDGLILPHMLMQEKGDRCTYLDKEGRCRIHLFRPGLCRTFPLGRNYEEGKLSFFLLEEECKKQDRTKVKVEKWLQEENLREYESFLIRWHYLLKGLREQTAALLAEAGAEGDRRLKEKSLLLLKIFYEEPYAKNIDFYSQFEERYDMAMQYGL